MQNKKRPIPLTPELKRRVGWFHVARLENQTLLKMVFKNAPLLESPLLDVGCGEKPYRTFFPHVKNYIGMQPSDGEAVDVIGEGERLPFIKNSFRSILCTQVLYHFKEPKDFFHECYRILSSGGKLFISAPQTWGIFEGDYFRFTNHGLRYLAESTGFRVISIEPRGGGWMMIGSRLSAAIYGLIRHRKYYRRYAKWPIVLICGIIQTIFGYIDKKIHNKQETLGWCLLAEKPL